MPILDNRNKLRRLGLSRGDVPPRLLSICPKSKPAKPDSMALKLPKAIDDPPASSGEEDSQLDIKTPSSGAGIPQNTSCAIKARSGIASRKRLGETGAKRTEVDDSSSEDDLATRADIQSTVFSRTKRASQFSTRPKRKESSTESEKYTSSPESKRQRGGEHVSEEQRRRGSPTAPASSGEHFTNRQWLMKTKKSKITYKKRNQSSQESVTKKGMTGKDKKNTPKMKIPEDIVPSSQEKPKARALLILPEDIPSSSLSPKAPKKKLLVPPLEEVDVKTSVKPPESPTSPRGSTCGKRGKEYQTKSKPDRTPPRPPAGSKSPTSSPRSDLWAIPKKEAKRSLSTDLSETEGYATEEPESHSPHQVNVVKPVAVCPWCGEEVDTDLLREFSKGKRLNVRLQTKFCQKHKQKTAEEVWRQKEYPKVEWDSLDRRFALHRDRLLAVINGRPSHFRTIHEKNIECGKARSMKKEGNMNPGYYGPRGFNIMCDYLVEEFGDLLKKKAVDDRVIAGRGSASFIQNVLVAELAVQMIREDMRVSEDKAIVILEDSKVLGELIHEDM
ncbi:hypothetical protein E4U42_005900 [Claviceps africana]|uniref:Restriction of telomere capping protein 4 n=1 Tax=Claviceps africana TaxID=83212 RepID=A0A8K0JBE2_9HYPO|nr:hypothetical protein E4U42_005900 [Claviceps africana]